MRITIFEGNITKYKPRRYQHAEISCQTDFTAPRLVIYTYKPTRWSFAIRRVKRHYLIPPNGICEPLRSHVIRIEAQMHGLDDLFHLAWATESERLGKRNRFPLTRWLAKTSNGRLPGTPSNTGRNSLGCDDISLNDASQLALDLPTKKSSLDKAIDSTEQSDCRPLILFLESGETCMLQLDTGPDRDRCLRALNGILNKNKLLHGYPDIEDTWMVTVRYKIRSPQTPASSLLASGFARIIGRRFLCLTLSEFLIVHCSLRQPEVVCPYSFVRQCASRKDGQFRILLGRASPLGECEMVLQMSNATMAQSAHEKFVTLMTQSGARYRQLRSSFVSDLSTEFTEHHPPLPRPSTVIHTSPSELHETRRNRVSFGDRSSQSEGSKPAVIRSNSTGRSWETLSQGRSQHLEHEAASGTFRPPPLRRVKSLVGTDHVNPFTHLVRKTHSADGCIGLLDADRRFASPIRQSASLIPATETGDHYVEMTDSFNDPCSVRFPKPDDSTNPTFPSSENQTSQMTRSGHSERGLHRHRHASFSSGMCLPQVTLRNRSHAVWPFHRSPPCGSVSAISTSNASNRMSRPTSHREDDTLFADVVYDPRPEPSTSIFGIPGNHSRSKRQSLTLLTDSGAYRPSREPCGAHRRLRAMSDVTAWSRRTTNPDPEKSSCLHSNLQPLPSEVESRVNVNGAHTSSSRFSSNSFLSSPVDSSARNSCGTSFTTQASCSNLKISHDLIRILEVGHEDQDVPRTQRPRAHTIGSSLMIGCRIVAAAVTASTCKSPNTVTSGRCANHVNMGTQIQNCHDQKINHVLSPECVQDSSLLYDLDRTGNKQSIALSFADHYVL